jgi:hypothetical protein
VRRINLTVLLFLCSAAILPAADFEGVIADWNCTKAMVRDGREKTLKRNRSCSLTKDYDRAAYGLITEGKKFYQLDEEGNKKARLLLKDTPGKDNLKVIVTGDLDGDTIKVTTMSML